MNLLNMNTIKIIICSLIGYGPVRIDFVNGMGNIEHASLVHCMGSHIQGFAHREVDHIPDRKSLEEDLDSLLGRALDVDEGTAFE